MHLKSTSISRFYNEIFRGKLRVFTNELTCKGSYGRRLMPRTAYGLPPSHASAIKFRSISPRKWKWIYPSFLPSVFPLNRLMALPREYIYLSAFSSCKNSRPAFLARANIVHEHERATIFVIVRADRDKGGARRIAIKPPRSFIFFLRFPRALPGSSATLFSSFD